MIPGVFHAFRMKRRLRPIRIKRRQVYVVDSSCGPNELGFEGVVCGYHAVKSLLPVFMGIRRGERLLESLLGLRG